MSQVKVKFLAFGCHMLVTLVIGIAAFCLVFLIWYPQDFQWVASGASLFKIVILVEVALGPTLSFVIYSSQKTRRHLLLDYIIVGSVQLSALFYGIYSTAEARPLYEVFVKDRLELVRVLDIDKGDLKNAVDTRYDHLSYLGPKSICVDFPNSVEEKNALLFSAVGGKDIQFFPKYYRACSDSEIYDAAREINELVPYLTHEEKLRLEIFGSMDQLKWLPVNSAFGGFVKVFTGKVSNNWLYLNLDPWARAKIES